MDMVEMVESTIIPSNTDRLVSTPDNEVQLMRSFDTAKLMGSLLSRNLHNWWARYTEMMHMYRLSFDAKICTDRLNLNNSLNEIEDQVEKVKQTNNPIIPIQSTYIRVCLLGSVWLGAKERAIGFALRDFAQARV